MLMYLTQCLARGKSYPPNVLNSLLSEKSWVLSLMELRSLEGGGLEVC